MGQCPTPGTRREDIGGTPPTPSDLLRRPHSSTQVDKLPISCYILNDCSTHLFTLRAPEPPTSLGTAGEEEIAGCGAVEGGPTTPISVIPPLSLEENGGGRTDLLDP